jgi:hypothetical protein
VVLASSGVSLTIGRSKRLPSTQMVRCCSSKLCCHPPLNPTTALMDMLMMVLTSGRERTESEFRSLLQEAGFSIVQVIRAAGVSVIESRPV